VTDPLPFTGERFTPECVREIWYEHWHRYAFALPLARGRRVLDAACGEGYGSALLAREAGTVLGVDIDPAALEHACARYGDRANLRFEAGDATALDALDDASFDLIVSMETLEHVHAQERMVAGFARLLAPGGLLLLSSPDKRTYSDLTGFRNEHHVRELYREELLDLLRPHFPNVRLFGQKLLFQSAIWSLDAQPTAARADTAAGAGGVRIEPGLHYDPVYYLALCARSAGELPAHTDRLLSLFGDREESVYRHYEQEIRHHIASGEVLADLERRLAQAQARASQPWWRRWFGARA
jgi:SAM-dependent methyltransferase